MGEVWITIPACKDPLPVGGDKLPPPPQQGSMDWGPWRKLYLS